MVPDNRIFARFPGEQNDSTLGRLAENLLSEQRRTWPACAKGFASLQASEIRSLNVSGLPARLQWNPQRIVSTAAKVDAASIKARSCFLCVENLPEEQQGILYRDAYVILCNPSPIFPVHFTVTDIRHRPQQIRDGLGMMLQISQDLGEGYVTFYNGPRCGASAPDHLHLQVIGSGSLPAESDLKGAAKKDMLREIDGVRIWKIPFYGRTHCVFTAADGAPVAEVLAGFLESWKKILKTSEEPMLNLVHMTENGDRSFLMFLRSKHRPDDYFRLAEDQVMVSPASVDMSGHIVTPVEKDFHAIDGPYIERMYDEVSADPNLLSRIIHAL